MPDFSSVCFCLVFLIIRAGGVVRDVFASATAYKARAHEEFVKRQMATFIRHLHARGCTLTLNSSRFNERLNQLHCGGGGHFPRHMH